MCGIVAIVHPANQQPNADIASQHLGAMTTQLLHRGPDAIGYYHSDNNAVHLGHTRLSIIDLENGQQPLHDNHTVLAYNGEIYNHQELRLELEALGHSFNSRCDTEVISKAWQQWNAACLERFNGMFAFVIFDQTTNEVFISRDRLGIKPLYWSRTNTGALIIASELKAIVAHPDREQALSHKAIADYFSFGYVPEPSSIYEGVYKLCSGHSITIDLTTFDQTSAVEPVQYWDCVSAINAPEQTTSEQEIDAGLTLLKESITRRTIADVPVGAFLSGGLDSSIIVSEMAKNQNVSTYSMGFDQLDYDESAQAQSVASSLQTDHTGITVSCNTFDYLPELIGMFDEPFADNSAIPTYLLTKQATKKLKVMLSGDGADELFLGYRNYRLLKLEGKLKRSVPKLFRKPLFKGLSKIYPALPWAPQFLRAQSTLEALNNDFLVNFHKAMSVTSPEDLKQIFSPSLLKSLGDYSSIEHFQLHFDKVQNADPIKKAQYIDFKTYLPGNILTKVDRTTMANSIEARVPFLDHRLVERWLTKSSDQNIKGRKAKLLLRKMVSGLLPESVVSRKKKSFTSPMDEWFRMMTQEQIGKRLQLSQLADSGLFNMTGVHKLIEEHYTGKRNIGMTLWSLAVFAEFIKHFTLKQSQK